MVTYARKRGLSVATVVKGHFPFPSASKSRKCVVFGFRSVCLGDLSRNYLTVDKMYLNDLFFWCDI